MTRDVPEYVQRRPRLNISGQCVYTTINYLKHGGKLPPVYVPSELEVMMEELIRMQRDTPL